MTLDRQAYSPQLDALRAFAVAGVLYSHFWQEESGAGHLGVRLFFVLSGFLITGILLSLRPTATSGGTALRGLSIFYVRRAIRIWPAYFLLLGTAISLNLQNIRDTALWHALFASNILFSLRNEYVPWVTAPWWSLSVEEQFYLVWPFLMLLPPKRALPWVAGGAVLAALAFQYLMRESGSLAASFLPPASFACSRGLSQRLSQRSSD
jgi:peptidoglycan/LPS O-acetylase OafA/YrhL